MPNDFGSISSLLVGCTTSAGGALVVCAGGQDLISFNARGDATQQGTVIGQSGQVALSAAVIVDGRDIVHVLWTKLDRTLWHGERPPGSAYWTGISQIDTNVDRFAVIVNDADGIDVFSVGNSELWHQNKLSGGSWSPTSRLDTNDRAVAVARNFDGTLESFTDWSDNTLWHLRELHPRRGWGQSAQLDTNVASFRAVPYSDGTLSLISIGTDRNLWQMVRGANGQWPASGNLIMRSVESVELCRSGPSVFACVETGLGFLLLSNAQSAAPVWNMLPIDLSAIAGLGRPGSTAPYCVFPESGGGLWFAIHHVGEVWCAYKASSAANFGKPWRLQ
jgi:hypothetical protein